MRRLYDADTLFDAQLLCRLLERRGIAAHVFNTHAQGALGEIPFPEARPQVWIVHAAQWEAARRVLAEWQAPAPAGADRPCPHCGRPNPPQLALCWACQRPLDAA